MYVLAWHSYDVQEPKLNGSVIGLYTDLDKAKHVMQQAAQDTIQYQENLEDVVTVQRRNLSIEIKTDNEYYAFYYIESVEES